MSKQTCQLWTHPLPRRSSWSWRPLVTLSWKRHMLSHELHIVWPEWFVVVVFFVRLYHSTLGPDLPGKPSVPRSPLGPFKETRLGFRGHPDFMCTTQKHLAGTQCSLRHKHKIHALNKTCHFEDTITINHPRFMQNSVSKLKKRRFYLMTYWLTSLNEASHTVYLIGTTLIIKSCTIHSCLCSSAQKLLH